MALLSVGKSHPMRGRVRPHRHSAWELICNAEGHGTMTVDGQEYAFAPGTVLLCPPGVWHDKCPDDGFTDYYMTFSDWDVLPGVYCLKDGYDRRLLTLLQVLHSAYYDKGTAQVCDSLAEAILGLVRPMVLGGEQSEYVAMLRHSIIDGFSDPDFSVGDAMAAIPVNTDHLRRLFVKETGATPHGFLTQLRLDKAKRLLGEPYESVAEVAFRSGFYDPLYFSRQFRKATGVAPSRWQKENQDAL